MIKEAVRMDYKWLSELTKIERGQYGLVKTYDSNKIIVWYDRVYDEYWTLDGTVLDKFLTPIKEARTKN